MNQQASVTPSTRQPSDSEVLNAMQRYGDGFESALAVAWQNADSINSARLHAAFRDLWADYSRIAAQLQAGAA